MAFDPVTLESERVHERIVCAHTCHEFGRREESYLWYRRTAESEETIELFAFMEAAAQSYEKGGVPVSVSEVLRKAREAL